MYYYKLCLNTLENLELNFSTRSTLLLLKFDIILYLELVNTVQDDLISKSLDG